MFVGVCWCLLVFVGVCCCCWLLLLLLVVVVGCCCWLLLLVAVVGCCCWLLLLVAVVVGSYSFCLPEQNGQNNKLNNVHTARLDWGEMGRQSLQDLLQRFGGTQGWLIGWAAWK